MEGSVDSLPAGLTTKELGMLVGPIASPSNRCEEKINELIARHNALVILYAFHFHETLDTRYNTGSPKERE